MKKGILLVVLLPICIIGYSQKTIIEIDSLIEANKNKLDTIRFGSKGRFFIPPDIYGSTSTMYLINNHKELIKVLEVSDFDKSNDSVFVQYYYNKEVAIKIVAYEKRGVEEMITPPSVYYFFNGVSNCIYTESGNKKNIPNYQSLFINSQSFKKHISSIK